MACEEQHVVDSLIDLMRCYRIKHLVDVGSESGMESITISNATGCSVTMIEGNPDVAAMYPWVTNAVIGATSGPSTFYGANQPGLSSLFNRGGKEFSVNVIRLDSFCADRGISPDALIIDTEGTTYDVLLGAGDLLNSVRVIYAEVQNIPLYPGGKLANDVDSLLSNIGFQKRPGLPSYDAGVQSNITWVRP